MYLRKRWWRVICYPTQKTYSNWSRMYANLVSRCPSIITSGQFIWVDVSEPMNTTLRGFALSNSTHLSIHSFGLSSVLIIPTWSLILVFVDALVLLCRKSSVRAMWCSASTRLEIREMSMRVTKASSCSGERWCEESERPNANEGIIAALFHGLVNKYISTWWWSEHTVRSASREQGHRTSCFLS